MYLSGTSLNDAMPQPLLIVLSHLRWDFVFQRPQQLMTRAARDFRVIFIEEPVFEGNIATYREMTRGQGITIIQPVLPPGTPASDCILHQGDIAEMAAARAGAAPVYLWYYTPLVLEFGHRIASDVIIFDKMDELSAFAFAPSELRTMETSLLDIADLVFTGGASLHAATVGRNANVHCFPSSIDFAHFASARDGVGADPADQADVASPRLGYFGVIDERIDLDLIAAVAALRPEWQIIMVGPTAKIDPATLPQAANIHWLGAKSYDDLPAYLAHWDMGWMPFALNAATQFISPTKTPEFLAAGLPLMSTPIQDVVNPYGRLDLVEIVTSAQAAGRGGDRLLADARQRDLVAARRAKTDAYLAGNSWDATWGAMRSLIEAAARPIVRAQVNGTALEVAGV